MSMNTITLKPATWNDRAYLEIEVDGKRLAHYFAGRQGAHPSQLSAIGWNSSSSDATDTILNQLLGQEPSALQSGRVPVLVCEECGDTGCGAFAVRVSLETNLVRWSDWAYENGREPAGPVEWPTRNRTTLSLIGINTKTNFVERPEYRTSNQRPLGFMGWLVGIS